MANSVDSDQTASIGAVYSGSTLFASILNLSVMLGNYLRQTTSADDIFRFIFTCMALAKAGLVVGPLRPSGRPSVCPSVRNTLGCQVCVICNSKSFHSFLFKLCLMIVHILKMCTIYFVHVS